MQQIMTDSAIEEALKALEAAISNCTLEQSQSLPTLQQSAYLARGITEVRRLLSDELMIAVFLPLCGCRLGFVTDRDSEPPEKRYPLNVVRECLIEALLRGLRPVGNEFNILGGKFYQTLEGFERKVQELPIQDLDLRHSVPLVQHGVALVDYRGSWVRDGNRESLEFTAGTRADETTYDERIPVLVKPGMGPDAISGKARRKYLARLYQRLTGVRQYDGDATEAVDLSSVTDQGLAVREQTQAERLASELKAKRSPRVGEAAQR